DRPDLHDLDGVVREVEGRGGRGQVQDVGDHAIDGHLVADVLLYELEPRVTAKLVQLLGPGGHQVVEDDDCPTEVQQRPNDPAPDEPGSSRNDGPPANRGRSPGTRTRGRACGR